MGTLDQKINEVFAYIQIMKRQRNQRSTKESAPPHKIIHLIVLAIALVIVLFGGWQLITPHQKLQKSWSINFTVPLAGTLVDGEKIYATDISGGFWQIHATTGAVEAYVPINMSTIYQPIAISNQLLGFISNQGTVIALDKSSLAEVWRIETDNFAEPELPQTDQHYLYFADRQSNVYVVDSKTGMLLWKKHLPRVSEVETSASVQPPTHTQFYSDGSSLYIGSVQSIYHCYLSSGQCQIIADDYNANLAIINASNNVIVYGDITNKYTVKDHITNKHIASLPRLLVFAVDANTVSLINKNQIAKYNLKSGDKTDIVTTDNQISSAIAADLDTVLGTTIQNHQTSSVFFTNSQQQALQWQTTLPQLCNQPSLIGEHVVVPCEQGLVYGIHSTNGAIAWRQPVIGSAKRGYTPLDQSDPLVIIQSDTPTQNSYLYGLDRKTGQILWKTPQLSIVTDSVMPTNKGVLMRSNQGHDLFLFAKSLPAKFKWPPAVRVATLPETSLISHINALCPLNRSLKLPLSMRIIRAKQAVMHFLSPRAITITETSNHPILELQVSGNDLSAVSAQFWQDFSRIEDRNGFIFRKNQFKVRFLPPQQGTWFWKVTAMAAGRKYVFTGSSKNLKLDQTNTLTISNSEWQRAGTPFNGVGWQTCITDRNYDGDWNDQWPLHTVARLDADTPSASLVSSQQYIQAMSEAGFNLMRFSFNNCSPKVTNCLTDTNLVFNQQTSAAIDSTLTVAKQNKMAVVFDIFGFEPWLEGVTDTKISPNLAKYLDYLIARYGSLIDVWELANESAPSEAWITAVSAYLKKK